MTNAYILSQVIGSISIPLVLVQYQLSKKRDFLIINSVDGVLYCVQLGLLSEYSGALLGLMPVFTSLFYALQKHDPPMLAKWVLGLVIMGIALILSPAAIAWWWWLPLFGFAAARTAEAMKNVHYMRYVFFISAVIWGVYAIYCTAWAALVMDIVAVGSNIVWLRRNKVGVNYST